MGSFDITIAQKVAVAVALPVASFLLYFLLKKSNEEEEEPRQRILTSRQTLIEVKVPRSAAGSIIGPRGARIKEVQDSTGARIQFKDDVGSDNAERTVVIRGQVEAAQRAEMIIRHMIAEIPPIIKDSINVPERAIGRIIGRGGETIRSLCRSSKCKINVPQEQKLGGIQRILLEGSPTAISTAKALIEEKVQEEEAFRARIAVNASNRQERGPRRREGGTENTHQEAIPPLQAGADSWDAQPTSEPAQNDDVVDYTPLPTPLAPEAAKWTNHRDYLEVYVSAVEHPGHFWVQVISSKATKLDDLSNDMTRFYSHMNEGEATTVGEIQEGDLLAAPFPFDDQWYRVRVTEVDDDKVDAYYVDFGDSYWVEKSKLKSLRSDFLRLPFQAIEVCLANVKPNGEIWSEDANILFEELTHMAKWKVVNARTVSYMKTDDGESMPCLELVDTNGAKDVNVAKVLIEKGHAVYVQEKETATSSDVSSYTQIDDSITYEEIAPESENKLMSSVDSFSSPSYCRKRTPHRNSRQLVDSSEEKLYLFAEKDLIDIVNPQSDVHPNVNIDISTIVENNEPFDDTSPCVHVEPFDQRLLQATFLEDDILGDLEIFYDAEEDQVKEGSECELKGVSPSDINEHAIAKMEVVNNFSEGEIALNSDKMEPTVLLETSIQPIQTQHENSENMTVQNKNEFLVSETKDQLATRPNTLDVDTHKDISINQPLHSSKMGAEQLYPSSLSSKEECHTRLSERCSTSAEQIVSIDDTCNVTDSFTSNKKGVLNDVSVEVSHIENVGTNDDENAPESVNAVHHCSQEPTNSCVSTDERDVCLNTVDESIDTSRIHGNKEDISKKSDFGSVFCFDESHVGSDFNRQGSLHDPCDNFSTGCAEGTETSAKVGCEVREPSSAADYDEVFGSDQLMPFDEYSSRSKTADHQTDQVSSTAPIQSPISYYDKRCVEDEGTNVDQGIPEAQIVGNFDFQLNNSICSAEDAHVSSHAVGGTGSPRPLDVADHPMLNSSSMLELQRQCEGVDEESVGQLLEEMCPVQDKPEDDTVIDQSVFITSAESDKFNIALTREARSVDCSDDSEQKSTGAMSTETGGIAIPNPTACHSQDEEQNRSISDMSKVCPPQDTDMSRGNLSSIPIYETQSVEELIPSPQADHEHPDETHFSEVFGESEFLDKDIAILVENPVLDTESKGPDTLVGCPDNGPKDVNREEDNTLITPSSEIQNIYLKEDDALVPVIQHQQHEISSSSAESFAFQDKQNAQPAVACSTENPSAGKSPSDLILTSSFEIKGEQSDCAFTRDIQEVGYNDDVVNSSVDTMCTESLEVPISDTKSTCLNQDEEQDASISDISEACTPENADLLRDGQTSIPECKNQHVKAEQVISEQDDSDNCSDQIPVPSEHMAPSYHLNGSLVKKITDMSVGKADVELLDRDISETDMPVQCRNEELKQVNFEQNSASSSELQNVDVETTEVLLPQIQDQQPEIPVDFAGPSKVQLQEQQETPDVVFCKESTSYRTLSENLTLSPSSEVQTEQFGIAFPKEVLAVDCTDDSEHTSAERMSTESAEIPICDTTMHVSQDQEQNRSITHIHEECVLKDTTLTNAEQSSFAEGETQSVNEEQLVLSQQGDSKHCPDQTHLSDICEDRQFTLVEKKTDILVENLDLDASTQENTEFARGEQSSGPLYETQHVAEEQVISPQVDGKHCSDQMTVSMDNFASSFNGKDILSEASLNSQLHILNKDTNILVDNTNVKLLDRESKETDIPVECSHEGPNDVNCEQNIVTLLTASSESQNMHLEQTEVLVPGVLNQEAEIVSSYAESFNVSLQNQNDAQPDALCSTENTLVETLHKDSGLSPSFEVQTEPSVTTFTREVLAVGCSDGIVDSSPDAMSTETCEIPIRSKDVSLDQVEDQDLYITDTSDSYTPKDNDFGGLKQISIPVCESQHVKEQQVILSPHVESEPCADQNHPTEPCMDSQFPLIEKDTDILVKNPDCELLDKDSSMDILLPGMKSQQPSSAESSNVSLQDHHDAQSNAVCCAKSPFVGTLDDDSVLSPSSEVQTEQTDIAFHRENMAVDANDATVHSTAEATEQVVSFLENDNKHCPHLTPVPLASTFGEQDHLSKASVSRQFTSAEKDPNVVLENLGVDLLDGKRTDTNITVKCFNEDLPDVNYESYTLMTSSPASQNMDIEQNEVLVSGMQHQQPEILSSSTQLSNMSLQDHHNGQSDVVCSTESPLVGTLNDESVLSPSSEVQAEQTDIAFTRDTMAVDGSDVTVHSPAEAMSIVSSETPLCDITMPISQNEEHSLYITDTSESCVPENFESAKQISIPVCEIQHETEQVVSSQEVDRDDCSHQTPVPLASSTDERDHLRGTSLASQDKDIEQNEVLVSGMQHQQPEIPSSSTQSCKMSLQDHIDGQSDSVCCTENPTVGTLDDESVLSPSSEVQAEQTNIAFTRDAMAVYGSDVTVHSLAEAMSIVSSETPLCDKTMPFSQDEEHSLSITDTSEPCTPENFASAKQLSIPACESHHATEQMVSSQEVDSEHCSHQTPVPLASSSGERDDLREASVSRQFTLVEKDTDVVLNSPGYELLERDSTVTNIPVECFNEDLMDVSGMQHQQPEVPSSSTQSAHMSVQDHYDGQSNAVCCAESLSVGTQDDDSLSSPSSEVQTGQSDIAPYRKTMAVDGNDETLDSPAEAMSIDSSETPLCDITMPISQNEEHSLSITDTSEPCTPENFESAKQISVPVCESQHETEQLVSSQEVDSNLCSHQTPVPLVSSTDERDHLRGASLASQDKDIEQDEVLVSGMQHQQPEILSSSTQSPKMSLQDHIDGQSDSVCCTESPTVGTLDDESVLSPSSEVQAEQTDIAFTRDTMAVDGSDVTIHSSAEAMSIISSETPLCDTTMPFSQDEEHTLSITDTSEPCTPENFASAKQLSIPACESHPAREQMVSPQEINSEHCSHQTPVPLASSSGERDDLREASVSRQFTLVEKDTDVVLNSPGYELMERDSNVTNFPVECFNEDLMDVSGMQHQQPEVPSSSTQTAHMSVQDHYDGQSDAVCCAESLSVGTQDDDSVLSPSFEIQTGQSDIAPYRETMAVDGNDETLDSPAEAMSIDSSETPLCDITMPISQNEEHSLYITDTSESCTPENFESAKQISVPVCESQQVVSSQEVDRDDCSHQTPVPLASSTDERDHLRGTSLASQDKDIEQNEVLVSGMQHQQPEIPSISTRSCKMSLQDHIDGQSDAVCCTESPMVGTLDDESVLSPSSEVQAEQTNSAFTRDAMAVDGSDVIIHSPAEAMSIVSSETPLCDTTMPFSQADITDTSESCEPEDNASIEQSQHSTEQLVSSQEVANEHHSSSFGVQAEQTDILPEAVELVGTLHDNSVLSMHFNQDDEHSLPITETSESVAPEDLLSTEQIPIPVYESQHATEQGVSHHEVDSVVCCPEIPPVGIHGDDSTLSSSFTVPTEQSDSTFTREVRLVDYSDGSVHSSADTMSTETSLVIPITCLDKNEGHSLSITDTSEPCVPGDLASTEQSQHSTEQLVSSQDVGNEHCSNLSLSFEVQAEQTNVLPEAVEPEYLGREEIDNSLIPATLELNDPETKQFEDCPTQMVLEEHDLQVAQHQTVPKLLTAEFKEVPKAVYGPPPPPEVVELNTPQHLDPGVVGLQKSDSIESRSSPESSILTLEDVQTERSLQTANIEKHETSGDEPFVLDVQEEPAEQIGSRLQFSSGSGIDDKDKLEHPSTQQCEAYLQHENLSLSNEGLSSSPSEVIRHPVEASIYQLQDLLPDQIQSTTVGLHNVQTDCTEVNDTVVLDDTTSSQMYDIEGGQEEMSEEISVFKIDDIDPADCHHGVVKSSDFEAQSDGLALKKENGKANIEPSSAESKLDAVSLDMSDKEDTEFSETCGIPVDSEEDLITTGGQVDRPKERISSEEHKSCLQELDKSGDNLQSSVIENIERIKPLLSHHEKNTSNDHQDVTEEVINSEIIIEDTTVGNKGIPLHSRTPDRHSPEPEDRSYIESDNVFSVEPIRQESDGYGGEMYQQKPCGDAEHIEVTLCTTWDPEHQVSETEDKDKSEDDVKFVQQNIDSEDSLEDSLSELTVVSLSFGSEVTGGQQSAGICHVQSEVEQGTTNGKAISVTHTANMEVKESLVACNAEQALDSPVSHQDIQNVRVPDEELVHMNKHQINQMETEIGTNSELTKDDLHELEMTPDIQTQLPTTTETAEEDLAEVHKSQKSITQMSEIGHSGYVETTEHMCTEDICRSPGTDSAYESPTRPMDVHTSTITGTTVMDTEETNLLLDDINKQNSECIIISSLEEPQLQKDDPGNLQPDVAGIVNEDYTTSISLVDHSKDELPEDWSGEDRRNQIENEMSKEEKDDNNREITNDSYKHQEEGVDDQLEESNCSGDGDAPNQMPSLMGMKMYKDLLEVITSDGSESVDSGLQLQDHLPSDDSKHDAIKEWLMVQASPALDTSSSVWSDGSNTSSCRELIDACQGEECLEIDVPCCMEASVDEGQDMGKFTHTESFILNPSDGECGAFGSLYTSDKFPTTGDRKGEFRLHSSMEEEGSRNPELVSSNYDERKLNAALKGCQESLSDAYFKIEPSYADATARKEVSDRLVGHLAPQYSASFRRCSSTGDIETEREMEYTTLASWSEDEYTGGRRRYAYDDQYGVGYDDDSSSMDSLEEQTYPAASAMRHRSPSRGYTTSGAAGQPRQCSRGETRHCSLYDEFQDMLEEFYGHASLVSVESATVTTSTSYASALEDLPSDDVEQVMTDSLEELTAEDIGATCPDILYPPSSRSSISQDSLNDIDDISSTYGGGEDIYETNSSFTDDSIEDAYDTDEGGPRVIYGTQLEQTLFDANITPTVEFAAPFPASPTTPTASQGSKNSQSLSHPEQGPCPPPLL